MKSLRLFAFIVGSIVLVPAMAQLPYSYQDAMRGSLYGLGQGLAAAAVIGGHPVHVEQLGGSGTVDSAVETRYFEAIGLRVVVLKFARSDFFRPVSVEVSSPETLRFIDHDWPEMNRAAIVGNFGPPISQTSSSMHYRGLAEICSDFMDIGLKDEKMVSVKWNFCTD
jgi:hypothetical protein